MQRSDQELAKQKGTVPQDAYDQKVKALELQVVAFQNRTQKAVRALEKSTDAAMAEAAIAEVTALMVECGGTPVQGEPPEA